MQVASSYFDGNDSLFITVVDLFKLRTVNTKFMAR